MIDLPKKFPTLLTKRLSLRMPDKKYIKEMATLANDEEVAKNLSSLPYPYKEEDAKKWIESALKKFDDKMVMNFVITDKTSGCYMGNIDLIFSHQHNHATLGYWLGKPYWGRGYMSEAVKELIRYGFEVLKLHRIVSHHFHTNPASGRVMQKAGMKMEGIRRAHFKKGDFYLDIHDFGILREEF